MIDPVSAVEREAALAAVRRAARLCETVRASLSPTATRTKDDRSPVTVADYGAQAVIALALADAVPRVPIVGEEDARALREPEGEELLAAVVDQVRAIDPAVSRSQVLDAIDSCHRDDALASPRRFVLDPIDGTLGFLRGDQYAIALALLEDDQPVMGILGCPALPAGGGGQRGCLFIAERGRGASQASLAGAFAAQRVAVSHARSGHHAVFCESVEARHSAHQQHARVAAALGAASAPLRMDSQCKYGVVARGDASIYLRLPASGSYREKVWDHAAGVCVIGEAGGRVTDVFGRDLDFSCGRTLERNRGIVATNGALHAAVLDAVAAVLEAPA